MQIKDSGTRRSFGTGSVRDAAEGKGRFDLLPEYALQALALHFEGGAKKYGDDNWRKGQPLRTFLDAAERHLNKFSRGEQDEPHAVAAAWNLLCLIDTLIRINRGLLPQDLNNLKPPVPAEACGNVTAKDLSIGKPDFRAILAGALGEKAAKAKLDQLTEDIRKVQSSDEAWQKHQEQLRSAEVEAREEQQERDRQTAVAKAQEEPKRGLKVYYAHPLSTYDTVQEAEDLATLKRLGFEVINPNTPEFQQVFKERGSADGMNYCFLRITTGADAVAFRAFPDGTIGAGVWGEIEIAWKKNIPIFELENCPTKRKLDIEQTREKIWRQRQNESVDEWRILL